MKDKTTLDVTGVPRYKASPTLQTKFITNADACGDHLFEQVGRKGNVAVYRRSAVDTGECRGFETVVIKTVRAGTVYAAGSKPTTQDTESYPGAKSFGRLGFHFYAKGAALAKMDELYNKSNGNNEIEIPEGPFTFLDFAKANDLPVNQATAGVIQKLLAERKIKFLGVVENLQRFEATA